MSFKPVEPSTKKKYL